MEEFGACKRADPTKTSLVTLREKLGPENQAQGSSWSEGETKRVPTEALLWGADDGAKETEGTGFGTEQTWGWER